MAAARKVVIVTGASSGLGLSLSSLLSASGHYKVYATARQPNKVEQLQNLAKERKDTLELLTLDVTKEDSINQAINQVLQKESKIDVLVNNAGFSFAKTLEATSMAEFREIFDTNFFGVAACSKVVVPHMRAAKSGHIINISSYGGLVGQPFNDAYCAAKFAVTGLTESMFSSLSPLGVKVTLVCPGAITTPFMAKAVSTLVPLGDDNPYSGLQKAYIETMQKVMAGNAAAGVKSAQTPDEVAQVIKNIIETEKPDFQYITSDYIGNLVSKKYVDITGNTMAQLTLTRSFGDALNK